MPRNPFAYYGKNRPYGPNGEIPMDFFAHIEQLHPEPYEAVTDAELNEIITEARKRGWFVIGPEPDGSYVAAKDLDDIHRLPHAAFLHDYLRLILFREPLLKKFQGRLQHSQMSSPHGAPGPDLKLVDP